MPNLKMNLMIPFIWVMNIYVSLVQQQEIDLSIWILLELS